MSDAPKPPSFPEQLWLVRFDPEMDPAPTFSEQRAKAAVRDGHEIASYVRGQPPKTALERLNSITAKFYERYEEHQLDAISRSWCQQLREERKARMRVVLTLAAQLDAIRRMSNYGIRMGESAIEEVIEGNWEGIEQRLPDFTFDEEPELQERYGKLWAPFVETLRKELIRRSTH